MAGEIQAYALTPAGTFYAFLLDANGQVWNGSAFVAYAVGDWATYDVALVESLPGVFFGTMPAVAAGSYRYLVYGQAGGSPASTDTLWGASDILWDGAAVLVPAEPGAAMTLTGDYDAAKTAGTSTLTAQQVWEYATRILTALDEDDTSIDIDGSVPTAAAIASQVRTELATELARIDAAITTRLATTGYTAPDNAGIADIPTNAEFAAALAAADDAVLAAIAALNNLSSAQAQAAAAAALVAYGASTYAGTDTAGVTTLLSRLTASRAGYLDLLNTYLDAAISTRLATSGYTAPDNANISTIAAAVAHVTYGLAALQTLIAAIPTTAAPTTAQIKTALEVAGGHLAEILTDTGTSLPATLAAIKAITDTLVAAAVTVSSPVAASGAITIYQADDYYSADSNQISIAIADATHVLGLDDPAAVVKLKMQQATWTASSVSSTGTGYTAVFQPTTTQTALITANQTYEIECTLANGHRITKGTGSVTVVKDIPAVV